MNIRPIIVLRDFPLVMQDRDNQEVSDLVEEVLARGLAQSGEAALIENAPERGYCVTNSRVDPT